MDKVELLARILQARDRGLTLIFTRTKRPAAKVADDLLDRGFAAAAVHGDLGQGAREQALRAFRSGKVDVLVATDVAARGLDVDGITHVINYQAPEDEMTYVHRIGRTARAGASGTAITLVDWEDLPRWKLICDALDLPFHEPPETYSTSRTSTSSSTSRRTRARSCPGPTAPEPACRLNRSRTSVAPMPDAVELAAASTRSGQSDRLGRRGPGCGGAPVPVSRSRCPGTALGQRRRKRPNPPNRRQRTVSPTDVPLRTQRSRQQSGR